MIYNIILFTKIKTLEQLMSDLKAFRDEVKDWLEQNCPPTMRTPLAVSYTHLTLPTTGSV